MKKGNNLRILKGSICAVLGIGVGYALYSLKKAKKVETIECIMEEYILHHSGDNPMDNTDGFKGRAYTKLADIPRKGDK